MKKFFHLAFLLVAVLQIVEILTRIFKPGICRSLSTFQKASLPLAIFRNLNCTPPRMTQSKSNTSKSTHFQTITQFKTDYSPSHITKYESKRTGMSVVVVSRESPKVLGFFALATEILDDSGSPHTLEHLCFLGSKNYRYKGLLDRLATKAYSGTNAWTATDHTAYTLDTAGWEGFAQILPIYLEHIIVPILTDSGCYTEVHHIDGAGHDAGVVYSEMQGVQNDQESLMTLEANRLLYPPGIGFRSETGGMMENLRVLTPDRIRAFHKEMYQPKNLCLVIIGDIDSSELLTILDEFEETILEDVPKMDDPWTRPWVDSKPVPALKESVIKTVEFPEEDESMGEVMVAFLGPDCNDYTAIAAIETLGTYLAGSSVSILEKNLVEIPSPWASGVVYYSEERPNTVIWLQLTSVPTKKLAAAEKALFEELNKVVNEPLDFDYLKDCLHRAKRQKLFNVETSAYHFTTPLITDFLFGNKDASDLNQLASLKEFDELEGWSEEQWKIFLKKYLTQNNHVSILGTPSAKLSKDIETEEKTRTEAQIKRLGPEGLKELEEKLEQAKKDNDPEIPDSVIKKFPTPGVDSIKFISTITAKAGLAYTASKLSNAIEARLLDDTPSDAKPLYFHFEQIPSNFVAINVVFSTETVPVALRPLLSIFMDNMFNTPITIDGKHVEYEQVVTLLEKDTVKYNIQSGVYIDAPETIRLRFQVEPEKYARTIQWLKDLLFGVIFDPKRLEIHVKKILSDLPEEKRSGNEMAFAVQSMLTYAPESIGYGQDTLVKGRFLKQFKKILRDSPEEAIKQMTELRDSLCKFSNMRLLIVGDIEKITSPVSAWKAFTSSLEAETKDYTLAPINRRRDRLLPAGNNPGETAYIVPLPTLDSAFAISVAKGPSSMADPALPALLLALAYIDAVEGPLWKAVRGTGLAYGSGFTKSIDAGLLYFSVYRSPNAFSAFKTARDIVTGYADGTTAFDQFDLEGAVSSIVVSFADNEASMTSAATASFINQVILEQEKGYNMELLKRVRKVTVEDLRKVMTNIMLPCFDPKKSNLVVTTAPVNTDALKKDFADIGFPAEIESLSFFEPKIEGLEEDDKDSEEDDEDEEEDDEEEDGSEESGSDEEEKDSK